jgi:EAL domain-containing protein (putative c-di-GMP-specific phosphodiesterase class I)
MLLADALLAVAGNYLAFWLRFDGVIPPAYWMLWLQTIPCLVLIRGLTFVSFHLYDSVWQYVGLRDLRAIAASVAASSVVFCLLIRGVLDLGAYPRSVFVVDLVLVVFLMGAVRVSWRLAREYRANARTKSVLIFGAGDAGEAIVREILNGGEHGYHPVGFVDDDPAKVGRRIHGVPVLGTQADLPRIIAETNPSEVLVAIARATPQMLRQVVKALESHKLPIKAVPHLRDVLISASMGIALTAGGSMQPEEVLHNADLAMYQAKAEGRGRYELYQPGLSVSTRERLDLQSDLRTAGARQELTLRYQPVLTLATLRPVEVEALIRWDHRRRGALLPADFIALSEETGLMVPMGQWVLREACRQTRAWQGDGSATPPLVVGVNLSASQFERDALPDEIGTILRETGLQPSRLQLEVSEAVLMRDDPRMLHRLEALKTIGVRLAIDDFGTGYASLSYLKRLPVDCLKIDRSLVKGVGSDTEDTAIVRAVVALARSLGIVVTAEGVETAEQLFQLRALGCEQGQGYYFARPVSADRLPELLSSLDADDRHGSPSCLG